MSFRITDAQLEGLEEELVAERFLRFVTWMRDVVGVPLPEDDAEALSEALAHARALRATGVVQHRILVEEVGLALVGERVRKGWDPANADLAESTHGA